MITAQEYRNAIQEKYDSRRRIEDFIEKLDKEIRSMIDNGDYPLMNEGGDYYDRPQLYIQMVNDD